MLGLLYADAALSVSQQQVYWLCPPLPTCCRLQALHNPARARVLFAWQIRHDAEHTADGFTIAREGPEHVRFDLSIWRPSARQARS